MDEVIGRLIRPCLALWLRPDVDEHVVAVDAAVFAVEVVGIEPDQLRPDEDQASAAGLARIARGQRGIESVHWLRDTAWAGDANTGYGYAWERPPGHGHAADSCRRLLYLSGVTEITRTLQAFARGRNRVLDYLPL